MIDPYFDWLGIPRSQRPPSPYALLGVSPNETDSDAIADAALLRILQLGPQKHGPHAEECADLIKQINAAKTLLTNPAKRAEYEKNPAVFSKTMKPLAKPEPEPDVDLADDSSEAEPEQEAPGKAGAWWSDSAPDAAAKPRKSAPAPNAPGWWKPEDGPATSPAPAATKPAAKPAPTLSPLTRGVGFDEFTTKHYAPPKKGNGKIFALAGFLLLAAGGAAGLYFTQQGEKAEPKKLVLGPKEKMPVVETKNKNDDEKPIIEPKEKPILEPKEPSPAQPANTKLAWKNEVRVAHKESARYVAMRKDASAAFSTGDDQKVLMHTPGDGKTTTLASLASPARGLFHLPKGDLLAVTDGGNILVIDTNTKRTVNKLLNPRGGVRCMAAAADGKTLYTGTTGGEIIFWNLADGKDGSTGNVAGKEQVLSLAISPDGSHLLAGLSDGQILNLTTANNMVANKWKANARGKAIIALDWNRSGTNALALSDDNELSIWVPTGGMKVAASGPAKETLTAALFDPLEKAILVASVAEGFAARAITDFKPMPEATKAAAKPNALAFNEAGTAFILGLADGGVQFISKQPQDGGDLTLAPLPPAPLPLPPADAVKQATSALRESEKAVLAATTVEARGGAAAHLSRLAEANEKPPETRKASFDLALEQYVRNLDFSGAAGVIKREASWFAIDPEMEWVGFIEKVGEIAPNAFLGQLSSHCIEFMTRWEDAKRFDAIVRVLPVAENAAKLSSSEEAMKMVSKLKGQVKAVQLEEGQAVEAARKLLTSPNDPEANRIVGRFECFRKKDFEKGVPLLAKGDNDVLKKIAEKDLADSKEAKGMVEAGHGWWNAGSAADIATDDEIKAACWSRGKYWYDKAIATTMLSSTEKLELVGRFSQLNELNKKLTAKPVIKDKGPTTMPGGDGMTKSNALLFGSEKTVTSNWTLVGARIQTDGVLFTEAGTITTKFTVGDNWRLVLTAVPGNAGLTIDVHTEKLVLPPAPKGQGTSTITYTIERRGNKLSFESSAAGGKSSSPKTTVILTEDKLAGTPLVIHPTGTPPAAGLLMKSAVFSGTIKLVKE